MHHTDHDHAPTSPPDDLPVDHPPRDDRPPQDVPGAGSTTPYTAPCRRCGRRMHLSEDELVTSLTTTPLCWFCAEEVAGRERR